MASHPPPYNFSCAQNFLHNVTRDDITLRMTKITKLEIAYCRGCGVAHAPGEHVKAERGTRKRELGLPAVKVEGEAVPSADPVPKRRREVINVEGLTKEEVLALIEQVERQKAQNRDRQARFRKKGRGDV